MLIIPFAFFLVMLEFAVGSHLALYALDVRNDSSFGFFRLQALINLVLFSLLAWGTQHGFTSTQQLKLDGFHLDFAWLSHQEFTLGWFLLFQLAYLITMLSPAWRAARLVAGRLASAFGIACLLCVGMGLRPIASATLGGFFTVAGFMCGALAIGGVSTAMLLGHWYLNTPTASGKPLEFATLITIAGIVLQIAFGLLSGPVTYSAPKMAAVAPATTSQAQHSHVLAAATPAPVGTPAVTPTPAGKPVSGPVPSGVSFSTPILLLLEYVLGLGVPLALSVLALRLERERSFQSATGMLYIAVVFAFFGEILARGLFLRPLV